MLRCPRKAAPKLTVRECGLPENARTLDRGEAKFHQLSARCPDGPDHCPGIAEQVGPGGERGGRRLRGVAGVICPLADTEAVSGSKI